MPWVQRMRSAMTVAGIVGVPRSSSRMSASTASSADGIGRRSYRGGAGLRNAARTVFLLTPSRRATSLMGTLSARCNRRISAQSSTVINPFLPGGFHAPSLGSIGDPSNPLHHGWVRIRPLEVGQYWAGVDRRDGRRHG